MPSRLWGKALTLVLSTHPDVDTEVLVLTHGPALVEGALIGRGDCDWSAERTAATQLVELAGRLGPSGCPLNALSNARRALAHTHKRRRDHAEAVTMFRSADAAMAPLRDFKALSEIPDEEMALAHALETGPER